MSFTETVGHPGTGNIVLQHQGFKGKQYDLDYRAHKRVVRVVDRNDDNGGLGGWKFDQDATGDLMLGMCWPQDKQQRELPMWSFHYLSILTKSQGPKGGVATPGAGADFGVGNIIAPGATQTGDPKKSSKMNALPIGDQKYNGDGRMNPITVPPRILKAEGPSNPNAGNGANPGGGPVNDPSAGPQGNLFGPNGGRTNQNQDTGGPRLILGIGGSIGSFGGQGVGPGSGFPTFGGVRTDFGGTSFPTFGTPSSFGGPGKVGVTFTDPSAPPKPKQ